MSNDDDDRYDRLPDSPPSVYTDKRHPDTFMRGFREYFETLFMDAAMDQMREKFPDKVGPRARRKEQGFFGTIIFKIVVFMFMITPDFIKRPMTRIMFQYSSQDWPDSVPMGPGRDEKDEAA
ncbi:MAG: hypothetical protein ABEK50_02015 [bacterium]